MIRYLVVSAGLGAAVVWWILADLSTAIAVATGIPLLLAVFGFAAAMAHRSRQLRSDHGGHPPQLVTHDGHFGHTRPKTDPDDLENPVHLGW